jgi:hypothetical protein
MRERVLRQKHSDRWFALIERTGNGLELHMKAPAGRLICVERGGRTPYLQQIAAFILKDQGHRCSSECTRWTEVSV